MRTLETFNVVSLPLLWAPSEPVPLLFFIFNLFFSWRNISVQCRVGICQTTTQLSYNCTYIPTLFNLPSLPHLTPLGYQEHQAELLALYNIYLTHDSAYMSVPLSQLFPPSASPPVSRSPFMSSFLSCKYVHQHSWGALKTCKLLWIQGWQKLPNFSHHLIPVKLVLPGKY